MVGRAVVIMTVSRAARKTARPKSLIFRVSLAYQGGKRGEPWYRDRETGLRAYDRVQERIYESRKHVQRARVIIVRRARVRGAGEVEGGFSGWESVGADPQEGSCDVAAGSSGEPVMSGANSCALSVVMVSVGVLEFQEMQIYTLGRSRVV